MSARQFADWLCDNLHLGEFVQVWNRLGAEQGALITSWASFEGALRHNPTLTDPYDEAHALAEARGFGSEFRDCLHRRLDPVIAGSSLCALLERGSEWAAGIADQDPAIHSGTPFPTPEAWAEWALGRFAPPAALGGDPDETPLDPTSTLIFLARMLAVEMPVAIENGWIAPPGEAEGR